MSLSSVVDLSKLGESCANCKFCKAEPSPQKVLIYVCKFMPKAVVGGVIFDSRGTPQIAAESVPNVIKGNPKDDWCGQWKAQQQH